jgi:hypothetical protein
MRSPVLCSEIARKHETRVELGGSDQCTCALTFCTGVMQAFRLVTARHYHLSIIFKVKARSYI